MPKRSDYESEGEKEPFSQGIKRRTVLQTGGTLAASTVLGGTTAAQESGPQAANQPTDDDSAVAAQRVSAPDRPYNVILFISDEEAFQIRIAPGFETPARDELKRRGTSFDQHFIASAMCTPSRGVMFSGLPPQVTSVFDQMEAGYVPSLSTERPSLGTIFKELGYATAYFGKFELRRSIITPSDEINYTDALTDYGFDTFAPDGDKVGGPDQAYDTDSYTAGAAIRWLRTNAQDLNRAGTPWLLVVSFVSPHDIMYADVNQPDQDVQVSQVGMRLTPPPDNANFQTVWDVPLSPSHFQRMDSPERPRAHLSYFVGWSAFLGEIPIDAEEMWRDYYNYYLNLIQDNDRNLQSVLNAISALGLWDSTVVMRTADHGELGGSHGGLRGKGPLPYEQETHVPAVVVHPQHPGGRQCNALTSHIDLVPTLVGLSGVAGSLVPASVDALPGHDFSSLLDAPEDAPADAVREAVLFNYVGLQTVDSLYMMRVCRAIASGQWAPSFSVAWPDLTRRGFISFVFDGRYKYSRYYAPDDFNTPETWDEIFAHNDLELFDLQTDPDEIHNLAADPDSHRDQILRMNALLNRMIAAEVGQNDGEFLRQIMADY